MKIDIKEFLERSYYITVDNRRAVRFEEIFRNNGLNPIPKRINGYKASDNFIKSYLKIALNKDQTSRLHNLFCGVSHLIPIYYAKMSEMPFVVVFEDDAVPMNGILEKLKFYLNDVPDDCDVLKLGFTRPLDYKEQPNVISEKFYIRKTLGAQSYIVFQKYYDILLKTNYLDPTPDESKLNKKDARIYNSKEPLFIQINENSDTAVHGSRDAQYYSKYAKGLIDLKNYVKH